MYVHVPIYIDTYMYIWTHKHTCACLFEMYAYACMYVYTWIHKHARTHTDPHTPTHTHAHKRTCIHTWASHPQNVSRQKRTSWSNCSGPQVSVEQLLCGTNSAVSLFQTLARVNLCLFREGGERKVYVGVWKVMCCVRNMQKHVFFCTDSFLSRVHTHTRVRTFAYTIAHMDTRTRTRTHT